MTQYTQEYIEALLSASHDPIVILDGNLQIKQANYPFNAIFGLAEQQAKDQSIFEISNGAWNNPAARKLLSDVSENHQTQDFELELLLNDNEPHALLLNVRVLNSGQTKLIFLVIEDITAIRKSEEMLRLAESKRQESEDRFRVVADTTPVLIWLSGTDKLCYFFNQNWLDFTGKTLDQEKGTGWHQSVHPDDLERTLNIYNSSFDARKEFHIEYRLKRHDGQYRWISDKGVPRYDPDGQFCGYIGGCTDIHDQKDFSDALEKMVRIRTEELEHSRSFLKSILNSTFYGIASYQPIKSENGEIVDFRIVYTNPEVPGNFGLTVDDVVEKTCREVYPGIFENGIFEKMVLAMKTGNPGTYEISVKVKGETIWLSAAIERVHDNLTVTSKNITKEKEAALLLENINEQLSHKNKELASLTYIASHDLQEPLRKIQMFISRIMDTEGDKLSGNSLNYFKSITGTAYRMQNLIDAVLSYSKMDSEKYKFEKTNLNTLLKEVLGQIDLMLDEKHVTVKREELPTIKVVPIHFQQLFLNIINNAVKYSKPDVKPEIRIWAEQVSEGQGRYWQINISDNGIGFDPQYKEKIFEAFQRLHGKMEYVGTGIGLAICQKIAQKHGGYITADGEPGVGATFHIYLPIKE